VLLTPSGWRHVLTNHPEIRPFIGAVLGTVHEPDVITPDRRRGRWRYWQTSTGPSRWLYVVVEWHVVEPYVVTAYGKRKDPP
jgi:hypothetical protein